jgi:hypothetical protein
MIEKLISPLAALLQAFNDAYCRWVGFKRQQHEPIDGSATYVVQIQHAFAATRRAAKSLVL